MWTSQPAGLSWGHWWPANLGTPSASGGQNDARYAIFANARRLAIQMDGSTRVFDTGEHRIGGVQQQQGGGPGSVSFTSQLGTFDVSSLSELGSRRVAATPAAAPASEDHSEPAARREPQEQPGSASGAATDPVVIVAAIESVAGLHQRGILSDEEFAAKKRDLLGRL